MYYSDYNRPPEDREPVIETNQFHVYDSEPPKKTKKGGLGKFLAVGLCCAIIGGGVGGGAVWAINRFGGNTATIYEGTRPSAVSLANVDGKTVLSAEEVYASNLESVVGVNGNVTTNVWGQTVKNAVSGSGFVISSNDTASYILTNYHVIDGVTDITVFFADGKSYDATLVGGEEENDIAVLKIDQGNLRPVVLGDSDAINVGEDVYAIGNPLGELTFTFTGGYVSAKDRSVTMSDGTVMNMIQTDTAINSGNSGGPLFDKYGQVVGIVSAKLSSSSSSEASVEGLGFAIPINDVKDMVTSIMENGYVTGKPNVGILMSDVDESAQRYGVPAGSEVLAILDGSCAQTAGLQVGDIITAVGDTTVSSSDALKSAIKDCKAGDSVTFTVYRSGETLTINVVLDEDNQERQDAMNQLSEDYNQQQQQQSQPQQGGNYYYNFPFGNW
ncbi:S1C family serine protease [uncultured Flavonifractor sp.]|uniref:Trypsin-like peptidase domain-containing protein n=1 Tax=Candidatus Flavonifractor intestinigallinarum TaxID=2838586 RepID=A0A9D2MN42_9FIRM|nr:trypsin-like peptidase domain-containing protein [uncultured Flavonifractor sp.]HJB81476.1 trypsin-like peptidase domain-containing protein [Candidatus Flavonifractor intestinigallinarum]